jgi:DNA repair exonuclease SbcCD ATPase subunit
MSRPKGPGVIKFLDATKQDDVAMRRSLWRGAPPSPLDDKLNNLRTERAELTVQLINLRAQREGLRRRLANAPMVRAQLEQDLHSAEKKINSAETALHDIEKQIKQTQKQIEKRSRQRKAVFPWQEKAAQLIMLHKLDLQPLTSLPDAPRRLVKTQGMFPMPIVERERRPKIRPPKSAKERADQDRKQRAHSAAMAEQEGKKKNETEDKVLSTQGATITTDELQRQLRAEGFKVGVRELRRFTRRCEVAGQQGKRTDLLASPDKDFGQ